MILILNSDYEDDDEITNKPSTIDNEIVVNYFWQEVVEKDTSAGLSILYFVSFVFGTLILIMGISELAF